MMPMGKYEDFVVWRYNHGVITEAQMWDSLVAYWISLPSWCDPARVMLV